MRAWCCTQSREKAISGPAGSGSRRNGCSGGIVTASTRPGRWGRSFVSINLRGSNLDEGTSSGERRQMQEPVVIFGVRHELLGSYLPDSSFVADLAASA